jgi:membrane associated rhomboid family serine protease
MGSILNDIRLQFDNAKALYRILLINVVVYLLLGVSSSFFFLFNINDTVLRFLLKEVSMPSNAIEFLSRPWTLFTYMFVHVELMHILFNLLVLSWTGRIFTEYLGNDKLWATYLLGGIAGGLLYFIGYNFLPVFSNSEVNVTLIGASAGVVAILVAIATLLPDYTIQLILVGAVKLKYLAIFLVVMYLVSMRDGNAGGELAHLGGAIFGFVMVKQLRAGRDLTAWLVKFGNRVLGKKTSRLKIVSRSAASDDVLLKERQVNTQDNIDRILDKINRSGFDSLTKDEKDFLYKASGKKE